MEKDYQPLVSVAVVTYNSSKTVLETLDSIYNQTYPNLELIVSDDCSPDNTVEICREWIETHKDRFVRTELLTFEKNTGVSANMNRGADACRGEWVKDIAGDDILLPDCVDTYVDYVGEHPEAVCVFSRVEVFGDNNEEVYGFVHNIFDYSFFELPIEDQYIWMITKGTQPIPAATFFYHRERMMSLGVSNDERIPFLEDWPKWIRLLEKKIRFSFIDQPLVKYRVSENSLCISDKHRDKFSKSRALLYFYYQYKPNRKFSGKLEALYKYTYNKKTLTGKRWWKFVCFIMKCVTFPKRYLIKKSLVKSNE